MRIFDPHIHMTSRTTDDYEAMAAAGIEALVEPAFWLGQPRTSLGSFVDYFDALLGWERFRAGQFGIRHHCTMGLNPKEANDEPLAREVLDVLPRYLAKDRVVAVGEIGFDALTRAEERAFVEQLELAAAHDLPVLVHTPHRDKLVGTVRCLELVAASPVAPARVLIDHNNELTFERVLASGCWCGFTIYPDTKMDEARLVRIVEASRARAAARQLRRGLGALRSAEGAEDRCRAAVGRLSQAGSRSPGVGPPGRVLWAVRTAGAWRAGGAWGARARPRRHVRRELRPARRAAAVMGRWSSRGGLGRCTF